MSTQTNARRPIEHELTLATPHIVQAGEIEAAEAALADWREKESAQELETPAWMFAINMCSAIEGWLYVAKEYGLTRRSYERAILVESELLSARFPAAQAVQA